MLRLVELKNELDFHLSTMDSGEKSEAIGHLYGVSELCTLIALRRGADESICAASGLLHDISAYKTGDTSNHAHHSSKQAKIILESLRTFDGREAKTIVEAIRNHTNKGEEHDLYSEILKDADVVHRYLTNPEQKFSKAKVQRIKRTLRELGITVKVKKK